MYCINEMSLEILLSMNRILSLESWKLGKKKGGQTLPLSSSMSFSLLKICCCLSFILA